MEDVIVTEYMKLKIEKFLGEGGFGKVYKCQHEEWGCVAFKKMPITDINLEQDGKLVADLMKEAKTHHQLRHANIVNLLAIVFEEGNYGILLEYMQHCSLKNFLNLFSVPANWKLHLVHDITLGMNYLHTLKIPAIHGDLKIQNVLVSDGYQAKISDFGLTRWKEYSSERSKSKPICGTVTHIPPEVWRNINLKPTVAFDVYSFGVLLWEILSEETPFSRAKAALISVAVRDNQRPEMTSIPRDTPAVIKDLIRRCWNQIPEKRPTFKEIKNILENYMGTKEVSEAIERAKMEIRKKEEHQNMAVDIECDGPPTLDNSLGVNVRTNPNLPKSRSDTGCPVQTDYKNVQLEFDLNLKEKEANFRSLNCVHLMESPPNSNTPITRSSPNLRTSIQESCPGDSYLCSNFVTSRTIDLPMISAPQNLLQQFGRLPSPTNDSLYLRSDTLLSGTTLGALQIDCSSPLLDLRSERDTSPDASCNNSTNQNNSGATLRNNQGNDLSRHLSNTEPGHLARESQHQQENSEKNNIAGVPGNDGYYPKDGGSFAPHQRPSIPDLNAASPSSNINVSSSRERHFNQHSVRQENSTSNSATRYGENKALESANNPVMYREAQRQPSNVPSNMNTSNPIGVPPFRASSSFDRFGASTSHNFSGQDFPSTGKDSHEPGNYQKPFSSEGRHETNDGTRFEKKSNNGSTIIIDNIDKFGGFVQIGNGNVVNVNMSRGANQYSRSKQPSRRPTDSGAGCQKEKKKIVVPDKIIDGNAIDVTANNIARDWKFLGRKLGFTDSDLDALYLDHHQLGIKEVVYRMLKDWQEKFALEATYKALAKALLDVKRPDVAKLLSSERQT